MEDPELAKIRQQRLAQLQAEHANTMSGPSVNEAQSDEMKKKQQERAKELEEMRNSHLSTVLTQNARARLATLKAAKPERARMVENIIIQNTRQGGVRVDEDALKDLLEKVNDQTKRETKVSYERRRVFDDDDEDED